MSLNNFLSPKLIAGAALAGIVGAAGVFIYEQVYAEKRRSMLVSEVQRLDNQMASMRLELEALRELQKETQLKKQRQKRVRRAAQQRASGDVVDAGAVRAAGTQPEGKEGGGRGDVIENSYASDSEYFTDYQSVLGTDGEMDSEEFYDVHTDEEDDTLRDDVNGLPTTLDEQNLSPSKLEKSPKSSPRHGT